MFYRRFFDRAPERTYYPTFVRSTPAGPIRGRALGATARMTAPAPDSRFDAFKLARRAGSIAGSVDARHLPNVAESLAPGDDPVPIAWTIEGRKSVEGRPSLGIDLAGSAPLVCQRCLGRVEWPVDQATEVLLAGDERELKALDDASEVEVILADEPLDPAELVEDELVLTLPFAPRHEGACPGRGE